MEVDKAEGEKDAGVKDGEGEDKEEDGSDIDSDGYNLVDDDSNVMVMSTLSAKIFSLDEEMEWRMKKLDA